MNTTFYGVRKINLKGNSIKIKTVSAVSGQTRLLKSIKVILLFPNSFPFRYMTKLHSTFQYIINATGMAHGWLCLWSCNYSQYARSHTDCINNFYCITIFTVLFRLSFLVSFLLLLILEAKAVLVRYGCSEGVSHIPCSLRLPYKYASLQRARSSQSQRQTIRPPAGPTD